MRRSFAQARKELTQILRDRLALAWHWFSRSFCFSCSARPSRSPSTIFRSSFRISTIHGIPPLRRRFSRLSFLSCRLLAPTVVRTGPYRQRGARSTDHPEKFQSRLARGGTSKCNCWWTPPIRIPHESSRLSRRDHQRVQSSVRGQRRESPGGRRRCGSGTIPAATHRSSTARGSSCWASPCFPRCWLRWRWPRKASRRPFCRFMFRAFRRRVPARKNPGVHGRCVLRMDAGSSRCSRFSDCILPAIRRRCSWPACSTRSA